MTVGINCPKCGARNEIPEAADYKPENFSKEGSSGTRSCIGCGTSIIWTGDQLVKSDKKSEED